MMRKTASMTMLIAMTMAGLGCETKVVKEESPFPRFKAGDVVMATHKYEKKAPIQDVPLEKGVGSALNVGLLPLGTKVRVIDDSEPDVDVIMGRRNVKVVPIEGELEGVAGRMAREDLKPVE